MFIVTKTTSNGTEKPVVFINKTDAFRYKRNLVLSDAYLSMYGEDFANETLNENEIETFNSLLRRIEENFYASNFTDEDQKFLSAFESYLLSEPFGKNKNCTLTDSADYIFYDDGCFLSVQLFEVDSPTEIETSAGKATAVSYDDGCAKGIHILLDDTIVCALDVYEEENGGEARVLAYKKEYDEDEEESPISCITINR